MIIDLQMTADHFVRGVRNQLRGRPVCYPKEVTALGETVLLDHLEVTDNTTLQRVPWDAQVTGHDGQGHVVPGSAVQVTQEVVLHFVTLTALQASGAAPTPPLPGPLLNPSVKVHFMLTLTLVAGRPRLHVEYRPPADVGGLDSLVPGAAQQIDAALAAFSEDIPLGLSSLSTLTQGDLLYTNAGLVLDAAGSRLAVRLENGTDADSVSAWAAFFAGTTPDRLAGRQWGLFIDKRLLVPVGLQILNASMPPPDQFHRSGGPSAAWAGSGRGVQVTQSGVVPDAGPLNSDVDVTVHLGLDFSVPSPDLLLLTLTITADAEVGGILGALMDLFGFDANSGAGLPRVTGWKKTGDNSYEHGESLWVGNPFLGHLAVEAVVPDGDGLHVVGSVQPGPPVTPARVEAALQPFTWGVHGSCSRGWRISVRGYLGLANGGTAPLEVCEARVLYDPDGQFPVVIRPAESPSSQYAATVVVEFGDIKPEYAQRPAPYPCLLLVKTNGGARVVSLGVPAPAGEAALRALQGEYAVRVVDCKQLVDRFWGSRLNPKWIPDPAPDGDVLHLWQVVVRGLEPAESVRLLDDRGQEVAVGEAGPRGVAFVRSVVAPVREGHEVTLVRGARDGGAPPARDEARCSIDIRQVLLAPVATLPAGEDVNLLAARHQGAPVLVVVSSPRARVYDLRDPATPTLLLELAAGGLEDAGLELGSVEVPGEFGVVEHGRSFMRHTGALIGDAYARLQRDNAVITVHGPKEVALI